MKRLIEILKNNDGRYGYVYLTVFLIVLGIFLNPFVAIPLIVFVFAVFYCAYVR